MGRRGPPPKPTELKVLDGNPGHQVLPKNEPKPEPGEPEMPAGLDAAARKEWRRVVPLLMKVRVLTEADGPALATYCETWSTYVQASRILQQDGFTVVNEKTGMQHARPEVAIVQQCRTHIRQFSQEFGMTPSARSRITMIGEPDNRDDMEKLLR